MKLTLREFILTMLLIGVSVYAYWLHGADRENAALRKTISDQKIVIGGLRVTQGK